MCRNPFVCLCVITKFCSKYNWPNSWCAKYSWENLGVNSLKSHSLRSGHQNKPFEENKNCILKRPRWKALCSARKCSSHLLSGCRPIFGHKQKFYSRQLSRPAFKRDGHRPNYGRVNFIRTLRYKLLGKLYRSIFIKTMSRAY